MKKYLPTSLKISSGFTLIELLVVIAIIAIISVISIALFTNVQSDARDGKRTTELESIGNSLEVNKTSAGYQPILATHFGGGIFPGVDAVAAKDPQLFPYCIIANSSAAAPAPADFVKTPLGCGATYTTIAGTTPPANTITGYKLCTLLENRGTPKVFCRTNAQ